jgi:hypothetical protein
LPDLDLEIAAKDRAPLRVELTADCRGQRADRRERADAEEQADQQQPETAKPPVEVAPSNTPCG